jgi:alpha-mannosidase
MAPTLAETLFTPALPYMGSAVEAGFLGLEGVESLIPCWAKPAADGRGWVLRLHETMGRRGIARLRLRTGLKAYRTDLSEQAKNLKPVREITVTPYELVSLRIR